ncbi:DUF805 domain-containing protein [Ramlibacter sp. XY19]|uniref:DUF805 domain-containing protein n=1 Tax=Ramlibacter paludis TaxID=2908000 RepID=UPI0023DB3035|nr:DUF805 domain-containing protein [Ramlibacter paludis]MCG2594964.1 DUF805 domain-containing protein [Ramlibacter paludis]
MTFIEAVQACFKKYATFTGRAGKAEFWWFFLFQIIVSVAVSVVSDMLSLLVGLGLLVPALAVGARRLHDIGKSGWLQLVWLIPLVGWIVVIYWMVQPTGPANEYGDGPAAAGAADVVPSAQA